MTEKKLTFAEYEQLCEDEGAPLLLSWPARTRETAKIVLEAHLAAILARDGLILDDTLRMSTFHSIALYTKDEWKYLVDVAMDVFLNQLVSSS